jgi:RHS repeat-associated protein
VHYYFSDHLGSSNVVTSATGVIEEDSDFYPFGGERLITDILPDQQYKFTGKERDAETNLDYFGARYYSSSLGRFMTPDWSASPVPVPYADLAIPQSLNLYSYVENNPITSTDPEGHFRLEPANVSAACGYGLGSCDDDSYEGWRRSSGCLVCQESGQQLIAFSDSKWDLPPPGFAPGPLPVPDDWCTCPERNSTQGNSTESQPKQGNQGNRQNQPRADYENPGHHDPRSPNFQKGKSVLPKDAQEVYQGSSRVKPAVKDANRAPGTSETYYGRNPKGEYYRYQGSNGKVHWNGKVPRERVPKAIRKELGGN